MKYLKLFNQHTDYETFKASQDYIEPNVSYCINEDEVHYNPVTPVTHTYVDLGLPSGTLWATTNIGATNPEELGDYFAWGETETKEDYSWSTYKFNPSGDGSTITKYNSTDGLTTLEPGDDAAHVLWGGDWHMPTQAQIKELATKCTWTWGTVNGTNGYTVSGNGNSIFLPTAGYYQGTKHYGSIGVYWSSVLDSNKNAYKLSFLNGEKVYNESYPRYTGVSIRPVITPTQVVA